MRATVWRKISRILSVEHEIIDRLGEDFLREEKRACETFVAPPVASESERIGLLLLPRLLDLAMQRKQATVGCFWLDELEHAECVHPSSPLLFRNEREALDTLGTNCAILRVLRRTFVAVRNDTERLYVTEVPGLCAALVVWLALSADVPNLEDVPEALRPAVTEIRKAGR